MPGYCQPAPLGNSDNAGTYRAVRYGTASDPHPLSDDIRPGFDNAIAESASLTKSGNTRNFALLAGNQLSGCEKALGFPKTFPAPDVDSLYVADCRDLPFAANHERKYCR